jgi:hypothetical protein
MRRRLKSHRRRDGAGLRESETDAVAYFAFHINPGAAHRLGLTPESGSVRRANKGHVPWQNVHEARLAAGLVGLLALTKLSRVSARPNIGRSGTHQITARSHRRSDTGRCRSHRTGLRP